MTEPIFWLGCSILIVAVCLAVALAVAIPALIELSRAAHSVEKLADTLRRELPPTLEAIRIASMELSDLSDDLSGGVQSAGHLAQQMDESLTTARLQARAVEVNTRSLLAGAKAAWQSLTTPSAKRITRGQRPVEPWSADVYSAEINAEDNLPPRYPEYMEYELDGEIELEVATPPHSPTPPPRP